MVIKQTYSPFPIEATGLTGEAGDVAALSARVPSILLPARKFDAISEILMVTVIESKCRLKNPPLPEKRNK